MLSRMAGHIYWMSRYLERAENTVRMLEVTQSLALTAPEMNHVTLFAPLAHTGLNDVYEQCYDELTLANLQHFFSIDENNPNSIYNCFRLARENAHAARGKITGEAWESLNSTWLEIRQRRNAGVTAWNIGELFDWVKERVQVSRGITYSLFTRTDAYQFVKLGSFLERSDNTARILLVRFDDAPDAEVDLPGSLDYYAYTMLLKSLGAFEAYQECYRGELVPENLVEMLVFSDDLPRSLRWCTEAVFQTLIKIHGDSGLSVKRQCAELVARLKYASLDDIREKGVSDYLHRFLDDISEIGEGIRREYLAEGA